MCELSFYITYFNDPMDRSIIVLKHSQQYNSYLTIQVHCGSETYNLLTQPHPVSTNLISQAAKYQNKTSIFRLK
jgi:hypothetical protein